MAALALIAAGCSHSSGGDRAVLTSGVSFHFGKAVHRAEGSRPPGTEGGQWARSEALDPFAHG